MNTRTTGGSLWLNMPGSATLAEHGKHNVCHFANTRTTVLHARPADSACPGTDLTVLQQERTECRRCGRYHTVQMKQDAVGKDDTAGVAACVVHGSKQLAQREGAWCSSGVSAQPMRPVSRPQPSDPVWYIVICDPARGNG